MTDLMSPERAAWLLANPLQTMSDPVVDYRTITPQPDGALLVAVLAVDR